MHRLFSRTQKPSVLPRTDARSSSTLTPPNVLADLREAVDKGRIQCGVAGMGLAVLHKGTLVLAEGFGKRNEQDPFTVETLAPIGSLTKAFTATAIGELVAQGKMDWDKTPVNTYLPDFVLKSPVLTSQLTLVDLLSHRTGLQAEIDISWYRSKVPRRELIKRLRHVDMNTKLSPKLLYNNIMYSVAGEAAANVEGIPYEKVVENTIIKPLGLTNTGFSPNDMRTRPNFTMPFFAESLEDAQKGLFTMGALDEIYMTRAPAGDMYSNVLDLTRWAKAVMDYGSVDGNQILNKESVQETLQPHSIMDGTGFGGDYGPVNTYGLGWIISTYKGKTVLSHSGSTSGFLSRLDIYPDDDLVIAQVLNTSSTTFPIFAGLHIAETILGLPKTQDSTFDVAVQSTKEIYDANRAVLAGEHLPERVPNKPQSHEPLAYVGEYTNPILGDVSIRVGKDDSTGNEAVYFTLGPLDSLLKHYHFDSFTLTLNDLDMRVTELITFRTGGDGKVVGLRLSEQDFTKK